MLNTTSNHSVALQLHFLVDDNRNVIAAAITSPNVLKFCRLSVYTVSTQTIAGFRAIIWPYNSSVILHLLTLRSIPF